MLKDVRIYTPRRDDMLIQEWLLRMTEDFLSGKIEPYRAYPFLPAQLWLLVWAEPDWWSLRDMLCSIIDTFPSYQYPFRQYGGHGNAMIGWYEEVEKGASDRDPSLFLRITGVDKTREGAFMKIHLEVSALHYGWLDMRIAMKEDGLFPEFLS
jgi:hypothetical protein